MGKRKQNKMYTFAHAATEQHRNRINELINKVALKEGFSKTESRCFQLAHEIALQSNFKTVKVGCVLYYKGEIIGAGCNNVERTDPDQKEYNLKYRNFIKATQFSNSEHSIHAEIAAVKSVPYARGQNVKWGKVKAFVYRVAPTLPQEQGLAKPCNACAHYLFDRGINQVYYSDVYGFSKITYDYDLMMMDKPYTNLVLEDYMDELF